MQILNNKLKIKILFIKILILTYLEKSTTSLNIKDDKLVILKIL